MNLGKENEYIEFKKSTSLIKEGLQSVSAILNKNNKGTIYFGVKDNGDVCGLQIGNDTLNKLSQELFNQIKPSFFYTVDLKNTAEGKSFIQVDFNGTNTPYSAYGRYYLRFHDEDRIMDNDLLRDFYLSKRKDYSKWEKDISNETIECVDEELLKKYIEEAQNKKRISYSYTNSKDILGKLGLLYDTNTLNNAGRALFSKNKPVQLKLAKFATDTRTTVLELNVYEGNIYECIEKAMNFYIDNINWSASFDGSIRRIEEPEIPLVAIREIVVNAFCHGDYNAVTSFELDIYKNRVCIYSPGQFPKPYTPEMFAKQGIEAIPLNTLISNVLYKNGTIEQFSTGFSRAFDVCEKESIKYDYTQTQDGFRFTFYRPNTDINIIKLNLTENEVFGLLKEDSDYTAKELAFKLNKTERTINRALAKLKMAGYIRRNGSDKKGRWIITE